MMHSFHSHATSIRTYYAIQECTSPITTFFSLAGFQYRRKCMYDTKNRTTPVIFAHGVFLYNLLKGEGGGWANCETRKLVL